MLKQRVITGVILALVVILAITLLPSSLFSLLALVLIVGVGGWEWARLIGLKTEKQQAIYIGGLVLVSALSYFLNSVFWPVMLVLGVVWWSLVLVLLTTYKQDGDFYKKRPWLLSIAGFLTLVMAWWFIQKLHLLNPLWVLYLIFLIAAADVAAYFTGKAFGKHKLAPALSPGKTFEGVLGGLFATAIYALTVASLSSMTAEQMPNFIMLSLLCVVLSVAGDLFESMIKREAGEKDSSHILPGHGGLLDRIDSLVAALPIFTIGLTMGQLQGTL